MAAALAALVPPLSSWFFSVSRAVREPYLDDVFHVRQAQHYCAGNWHIWDPKITTPPGLYLISAAASFLGLLCSIDALRAASALCLPLLLLLLSWTSAARINCGQKGTYQVLVGHMSFKVIWKVPQVLFPHTSCTSREMELRTGHNSLSSFRDLRTLVHPTCQRTGYLAGQLGTRALYASTERAFPTGSAFLCSKKDPCKSGGKKSDLVPTTCALHRCRCTG